MDDKPRDAPPSAPARGNEKYPLHKIVAAVARAETDRVVAALGDAGFARDRVEVVTAEDVPPWTSPLAGLACVGC